MHSVLPLNDTQLVFLPQNATGRSEPYVVQITMKSDRPQDVGILVTYMLAQRDITEIAIRLVIEHMSEPLPAYFVIDDDEYTVTATHRKWTYGQKLNIAWGESRVMSCEDKWTFTFALKDPAERCNDSI